jgi:hypothetical protein
LVDPSLPAWIIAGTDCGFGTFAAAIPQVFPSIGWAKLKALHDGAELVST